MIINGLDHSITQLNGEIIDLKKENKHLTLRMAEIEAKINKNSSNSSKPPSYDGLKKIKENNQNIDSYWVCNNFLITLILEGM